MTIKIQLPECDGIKLGSPTRVFTDDGIEITDITSINVSILPDCFVTATIDVCVNSIEDMDNIHALLGTKTLECIAEMHGYKMVKNG